MIPFPPRPSTRGDQGGESDAAQKSVVILSRDLFFGIRLQQLLSSAGWTPRIVPTTEQFLAACRDDRTVRLGLIDMGAHPDWALLREVIAHEPDLPPIVAFGPHKDVESFRAAKSAGVTRVISNGDFHRDTLGVIARYARAAQEDQKPSTGDRTS